MFKCKICGKKYNELAALYNHIENKHKDMIPKDMTVQQYYYYMKTGKMNGNCVMCKNPTGWNHNTGKYNRFCGNPKCKDEYVKIMKSRMVAKYGKTHLLNDPNKQREMLANRSISGVYKWSDGKHETTYTGSYELDFLRTLDNFFDWDPEDISMPSPHTYTYKYEGEDKFYIPDVFIHSLDLEIEIKDGGDNPNNHHKIQDVDKEKERLKDEVLCSQKAFHYVKITNKNYENLFRFLKEIKQQFEKHSDETKIPRIFKIEDIKGTSTKPLKESTEIIDEGFHQKANDLIVKFDKFTNVKYRERDYFFSLRYDLAKNNPKEMQKLLSGMIKAARFKDDLHYVEKLSKKANDHYQLKIKKHPEFKDPYNEFYKWLNDGGMNKEMNKKRDKLKESVEISEESYIINTMKESSISIPQMNYYLQNEYEEEMKNYLNTYKKYYNLMLKEQPAAVKHINEDIRQCLIVIDGLASKGVENNLVQFAKDDLGEIVKASKKGKPVKVVESVTDKNIVDCKSTDDFYLIHNNSMGRDVINTTRIDRALYHIDPSLNDINTIIKTGGENVSVSNDNNFIKYVNDKINPSIDTLYNKDICKKEKGNIINCKITYLRTFKSNSIFTLTDTNSKLIIENLYVIQRDKVGTHCSITPLYSEQEEESILEFQIILNESVDIQSLNNKLNDGVNIANLHKFNDNEFKFIKESCMKLFGVYPKEIKIK